MSNSKLRLPIVTLISMLDGGTYDFADDGSDTDPNTGAVLRHRIRRSVLLQQKNKVIRKGPHAGFPLYFVERAIEPQFRGDPVATFPVLTAEAKKVMAANVAERKRKADEDASKANPEVAAAIKAVTQRNAVSNAAAAVDAKGA